MCLPQPYPSQSSAHSQTLTRMPCWKRAGYYRLTDRFRSNVFSCDFFRPLLPLCCIVAEEVFKRFIIGQACQDSLAGVLIGDIFLELFSQGFELCQESAVLITCSHTNKSAKNIPDSYVIEYIAFSKSCIEIYLPFISLVCFFVEKSTAFSEIGVLLHSNDTQYACCS